MGYGVAMPKKCYTHLSAEDRETLSLGLAQGQSLRMMARVLGRAPSTVSRESARNTTRGRPYRACTAQTLAVARARHPRRPRKLLDPWLWQYVRTHLAQGGSPEQIAGRLRRAYPGDMRKQLSTETIYVGLYVLPRGTLRSELLAALRQARKARRPRARGADRRGPPRWPPARCPATGRATSSRGPGMARRSVRWWSGRRVWSAWPGWRGRMRYVPARASRRNSGTCPPCCEKP